MTKATIAERFVGTQTTKSPIDENLGNVGDVRFKNDELIYATRSWMTDVDDQIDALFKALSAVNRLGLTACTVFADTPLAGMKGYTNEGEEHDLGVGSERVVIDCGETAIDLVKTKFPTTQVVEVSEVIGSWKGK